MAGNKQQTLDLGKLKEKRHAGSKVLHLCKKDDELTSHLFNTCPYAGQLWTEFIRTRFMIESGGCARAIVPVSRVLFENNLATGALICPFQI